MTTYYYIGDESSSDIISTEGGDGLLIYTLPTDNSLLYSFNVDWDGDGVYDGFNEADNLTKWTSSRGRERIFNPSGRGFQPYEIGRLTVTLDNKDGRYDPWNASGPLYGNLMPGRDMEFKIAYPSTDAIGVTSEYVFTGTVVDIQVGGYKKTVNIICEDGWRFLAEWEFMRFPFTTSYGNVENEIDRILMSPVYFDSSLSSTDYQYWYLYESDIDDGYPYPSSILNHYPWGVDYTVTMTTDFSSTDVPRHWWWEGSAKQAVEMITFGSLGRSIIQKDGKFNYYSADEYSGVWGTYPEEELLKSIYLQAPWDNMYSRVVLRGSNNFWYPNEEVARITAPIKIDAGQTVSFSLRTSSTDLDIEGDYCTRITGVNVTANTTTATTDTDLTSDFTYTVDPLVRSFKVSVTNGSTDNGYLNEFEIVGELLDVINTEWAYETTSAYRNSDFVLDNPWLSITAVGSTDNYFQETSTTLDDRARINTIGETLKSYLSTLNSFPIIQLQGRWYKQFGPELEEVLYLYLPTLGIDDNRFRLSKIKHESLGSPQDVLTTFWVYPRITVIEST